MSKVLINPSTLTNIANAIREKNNTQNTYKPSQMASAITQIVSGGGNAEDIILISNEFFPIIIPSNQSNETLTLNFSRNNDGELCII